MTSPAPPLAWSEDFRTGFPRVDEQHQELFRLTNNVWEASNKKMERGTVEGVLRFLLGYVEDHFAEEERYMRASHYPNHLSHRSDHQELTKKLRGLVKAFQESGELDGNHLARFLGEWLVDHINKIDRPFVAWIKDRWGGDPIPRRSRFSL